MVGLEYNVGVIRILHNKAMSDSVLKLYRIAEIRAAERIAIQELGIPGLQLMRSAGLAAFNALKKRWPEQRHITVFCGCGNNAGDGYVIAKLALQAGMDVTLYSLADVLELKGDALTVFQEFVQAGGWVREFSATGSVQGVAVDALLGTGLNRSVGADYAAVIQAINRAGCPVLAVDVPSGLQADTGAVMGYAVKADLTVTFIALKSGLFTGEAADYCGEIICSSLNLPEAVIANLPIAAEIIKKTNLPVRSRSAHKGHFGHVLLIGGNHGFAGAIRLAAEAALRSGAGLVSVASRASHSTLLNIGRPELMVHGVECAEQLQALLLKASVIVIGPGLGQDDWASALFEAVAVSQVPLVLDADALNLLVKKPRQRACWVLTPHPGEAARLLKCSTADIATDRYAAVRSLQTEYGGVVVLKGAGSLLADSAHCFVCPTGNPGMATGGMGDVLAGILGGLLAQKLSLLEAAKLAVYLHGEAADHVAAEEGERGMLASDLLPKLRELLN